VSCADDNERERGGGERFGREGDREGGREGKQREGVYGNRDSEERSMHLSWQKRGACT
jgi:hypothetical protein